MTADVALSRPSESAPTMILPLCYTPTTSP
ncbi:hypothetical protein AZE42_13485 [Rhizopogon vesiculosus]|uniref:Uncharacterized protein n=1 Tax=Rhizopogon vesiculosus TaxID=180088 RepID=A0A1J8Q4M4_9AGAM|nr:hypothetical protein AZE42_13485 [Rhizopogon vesiculosus]